MPDNLYREQRSRQKIPLIWEVKHRPHPDRRIFLLHRKSPHLIFFANIETLSFLLSKSLSFRHWKKVAGNFEIYLSIFVHESKCCWQEV